MTDEVKPESLRAPCHVCNRITEFYLLTDNDGHHYWECSECCFREDAILEDE